MYLIKKYCLIFSITLLFALSFNIIQICINPQKTFAGEATAQMQRISLRDNFEYVGFRYSEKEIGEMSKRASELATKNQYQKAYDIYSELIDAIPNSASFYTSRAMMSMSMKNRENTISDFDKAIEIFKSQENFETANILRRMVEKLNNSDLFER